MRILMALRHILLVMAAMGAIFGLIETLYPQHRFWLLPWPGEQSSPASMER